jgi:DNA polymerase III delta prime subunit
MIIGHQKIRDRLFRSTENGVCVQTYLFTGPESVGKFEVAKEFAFKLISNHFEQNEKFREKEPDAVKSGIFHHDQDDTIKNQQEIDLFVLEPEREVEKGIVKERDISVERTREATRFLGSFPYTGQKKVLIIRDAHRLTEAAQNALLKILEEPPSYAVIILTTHELGRILPTTLSRCQQISFRLVSTEEMTNAQSFHAELLTLPPQNMFLLALGRPGLVMQSLKQEAECANRVAMLAELMHLSEKPLRERLILSESCAKDVLQTMQLLMWWMGGLHSQTVSMSQNESALRLRNIETIEKIRLDLKRFPSSARLLLDTFFLHWQ